MPSWQHGGPWFRIHFSVFWFYLQVILFSFGVGILLSLQSCCAFMKFLNLLRPLASSWKVSLILIPPLTLFLRSSTDVVLFSLSASLFHLYLTYQNLFIASPLLGLLH